MIIDRDRNNMHIVIGSVVQANEAAPDNMVGMLGIVTDKGPYGVTMKCQSPDARTESRLLTWEQVDYIGQMQTRRKS